MGKKKQFLYKELVKRKICKDDMEAKSLVMSGKIIVGQQRIDKPAFLVSDLDEIRIKGQKKYVSRGGEKLESAIKFLNLQDHFKGRTVLDIGSSTGGFTDCVLALGAKKVIALDVGSNQLDWKLRNDERVLSLENTHIKDFNGQDHPNIQWILADISFNSISRLINSIAIIGDQESRFLILVKPQFELPKNDIPEGGIITDQQLIEKALQLTKDSCREAGLEVLAEIASGLKGRYGNQEYFLYMKPATKHP